MQNIELKPVQKILRVAVMVILKGDCVLIARRAKEAHQGGLWEFPGGKVEAGETIETACEREIQEELGITILESRPLIKILHHYADKSVLLETRLCTLFEGKKYLLDDMLSGKARLGLEGQLVKWVKIEQLDDYHFPEASQAIINALRLADKYVISPDCIESEDDQFIEQFEENCRHYSLIQFRIKSLKGRQLKNLLHTCSMIVQKKMTQNKKITLMLNSDCIDMNDDIVTYAGIHLTSTHLFDNDFIHAFRAGSPEKMISASCHHPKDIEQANYHNLSFIVISPVQKTSSHPQQKALGWEQFKFLSELAQMPCFALGGMKINHMSLAQSCGGQGIAAISGLWHLNNKNRGEKI